MKASQNVQGGARIYMPLGNPDNRANDMVFEEQFAFSPDHHFAGISHSGRGLLARLAEVST